MRNASLFWQRWSIVLVALLILSVLMNIYLWLELSRRGAVKGQVSLIEKPIAIGFIAGGLFGLDSIVIKNSKPIYFYLHGIDNRNWYTQYKFQEDTEYHRELRRGDPFVDTSGYIVVKQ